METLFFYTGAIVWLVLLVLALWIAGELAVGVAAAVSVTRWHRQDAKVNGRQLFWREFPGFFIGTCLEHAGYRNNGNIVYGMDHGSTWRGIGNWKVVKKPAAPPEDSAQPEGS